MRPNWPNVTDTIAREVFGLLFEASLEAVFIIDRTTEKVVSANIAADDMLRRELGGLVGLSLDELAFEPRDLRGPGFYEDVALRGGDDYPVYVELNVLHVPMSDRARDRHILGSCHDLGELAAYTARDTSEHRSMQRELVAKHAALFTAHAELERAHAQLGETKRELEARNQEIAMLAWRASMGELVAGIAHHLNNPVGALASTLRRLSGVAANVPEDERPELQRLLQRAAQIARRIETNVGAIVEASRASARAPGAQPISARRELPPELSAVLTTFMTQLEQTKDLP